MLNTMHFILYPVVACDPRQPIAFVLDRDIPSDNQAQFVIFNVHNVQNVDFYVKGPRYITNILNFVLQGCYTNKRNSFNFYQLIKLSMSDSAMVKQIQILHQRRYFLFEVILSTRMSIFDDQQVLLESQFHSNEYYVMSGPILFIP